jgi:hypothetical protein
MDVALMQEQIPAALACGQKPQEISVATSNLLTVRSKDFKEAVTS